MALLRFLCGVRVGGVEGFKTELTGEGVGRSEGTVRLDAVRVGPRECAAAAEWRGSLEAGGWRWRSRDAVRRVDLGVVRGVSGT